MPTLLYTGKLSITSPSSTTTYTSTDFKTGSYSARGSRGFYNIEEQLELQWVNLTLSEIQALITMFDNSKSVSTVQYTPPTKTAANNYIVKTYSSIQLPNGKIESHPNARFNLSASLQRVLI